MLVLNVALAAALMAVDVLLWASQVAPEAWDAYFPFVAAASWCFSAALQWLLRGRAPWPCVVLSALVRAGITAYLCTGSALLLRILAPAACVAAAAAAVERRWHCAWLLCAGGALVAVARGGDVKDATDTDAKDAAKDAVEDDAEDAAKDAAKDAKDAKGAAKDAKVN